MLSTVRQGVRWSLPGAFCPAAQHRAHGHPPEELRAGGRDVRQEEKMTVGTAAVAAAAGAGGGGGVGGGGGGAGGGGGGSTEVLEAGSSSSRRQGVKRHRHKHNLKHRYELEETLGRGAYGKVKRAVERATGRKVAIKFISKERIKNEKDMGQIRREIEIMSSLHHPHIVSIFEVFENKDKMVIVMELASHGELFDYLNAHRPLRETEARRLFRQIVSAVHHCHKSGVVHRDLKLENILLDESCNIKIADFGLSNLYAPDRYLSTFCGSPLYASPEIINGRPYRGPEVDSWALGVLLYAIVYGAMPFDGHQPGALIQQISAARYQQPARPSEVSELISRLLVASPEQRASSQAAAHHRWVNWGYRRCACGCLGPPGGPTQARGPREAAARAAETAPRRAEPAPAAAPAAPAAPVLPASRRFNGALRQKLEMFNALISERKTLDFPKTLYKSRKQHDMTSHQHRGPHPTATTGTATTGTTGRATAGTSDHTAGILKASACCNNNSNSSSTAATPTTTTTTTTTGSRFSFIKKAGAAERTRALRQPPAAATPAGPERPMPHKSILKQSAQRESGYCSSPERWASLGALHGGGGIAMAATMAVASPPQRLSSSPSEAGRGPPPPPSASASVPDLSSAASVADEGGRPCRPKGILKNGGRLPTRSGAMAPEGDVAGRRAPFARSSESVLPNGAALSEPPRSPEAPARGHGAAGSGCRRWAGRRSRRPPAAVAMRGARSVGDLSERAEEEEAPGLAQSQCYGAAAAGVADSCLSALANLEDVTDEYKRAAVGARGAVGGPRGDAAVACA
ncbi:NUAK family SNF1-like kinase 1 [Lethenteron reissneri]|uniref:NUAK family SNF1-like kinase 1 n=1 Tax=Lethenteron reissneri TaxID=7753 RepID=UPI002AB6C734|nr:NUAK family SNF1-like kinase 1 [Lethenteron reissneri]